MNLTKFRGGVNMPCNLKYKQVVGFNLTNRWHFGIISKVGRKWIHIKYRKAGKDVVHKVLKDNANTDIREV